MRFTEFHIGTPQTNSNITKANGAVWVSGDVDVFSNNLDTYLIYKCNQIISALRNRSTVDFNDVCDNIKQMHEAIQFTNAKSVDNG